MTSKDLIFKIAPGLLGAFFVFSTGCREKDQAGDWSGHSAPQAVEVIPETPATPSAATPPAPAALVAPAVVAEEGTLRFMSYNVENWLVMSRQTNNRTESAPKPEKERNAAAGLIAAYKPDVVGIVEIGTEEDVNDLQARLAAAGHPMPHFHLNLGSDPVRRVALLSLHPIRDGVVRDELNYRSQGKEYAMQRGILDATVDSPAGSFRFLGVHLKSKREIEDGDQEDMRLNESHLLRRELNGILTDDSSARLVVFGDFNDTRNSPTLQTIRGSGNRPESLVQIALKDSRGHFWTHHWEYQDVYSRFDYVMVSQALRSSVLWDESKVIDDPEVASASDHRPLLVVLK